MNTPQTISPRVYENAPIRYALKYMAMFTYVPILFFNETYTFSLPDLEDMFTRDKLLSVEREESQKAITSIHRRMKTFIDQALTPAGVKIHDMVLQFTIDLRTGFYFAKHLALPSMSDNMTNLKIYKDIIIEDNYEDPLPTPEHDVVPFMYPAYMKKRIHGLLAAAQKHPYDENRFSKGLAYLKVSYNRKYIFDKGKRIRVFELEKSFPFRHTDFLDKTRKWKYPQNFRKSKTMKRPKTAMLPGA